MSIASNLVSFIVGAIVGSVVAWQHLKGRYEERINEEIKSVKDIYAKKESIQENPVATGVGISEYAKKLHESGYTDYTKKGKESDSEQENFSGSPYVISPDEFEEKEDYEKICLTYYADSVLADDNNEMIDDPESVVGDGLEHIGEYEEYIVHVRDDSKRVDYEITCDFRCFWQLP